jgi:preprotein translocase subunit SecG
MWHDRATRLYAVLFFDALFVLSYVTRRRKHLQSRR